MEQAAEQTRWTYEDALSWIAGNFRWNGGRIKATPGYEPTENDRSAIRYLCGEHGFEWREL